MVGAIIGETWGCRTGLRDGRLGVQEMLLCLGWDLEDE